MATVEARHLKLLQPLPSLKLPIYSLIGIGSTVFRRKFNDARFGVHVGKPQIIFAEAPAMVAESCRVNGLKQIDYLHIHA